LLDSLITVTYLVLLISSSRQFYMVRQWFTNQWLIGCSLQVRQRHHETLGRTLRRCFEPCHHVRSSMMLRIPHC